MRYVQEVNVFQIVSFVQLCILVLLTLGYVLISLVHLLLNNVLRNPVQFIKLYVGMENVWIFLLNVRLDHYVLPLIQLNVQMDPVLSV